MEHSSTVLAPGVTLGERYMLLALIGTGGMASVWTARDARLQRTVAVKVISDNLALDPTFLARFEREAHLAAALAHPHVVSVYDFGTDLGRPYLVMEHVAGGTLADRLRAGGGDWNPTVLAKELLGALAYIHAAGVLHRDLKPANVLIGEDGRARLTDFGIAHLADATRLTSTGLVMGTVNYAAPEVLRGATPGPPADVYSCGVLLRQCAGPTSELSALLDAMTDPDPGQRPSAAAALERLEGTTSVDVAPTLPLTSAIAPTTVLPEAEPAAAPGPPGSSRRLPARAAILALVVAVVLIAVLNFRRDAGAAPLDEPPSGTTLSEQLDELDGAIDRTRR